MIRTILLAAAVSLAALPMPAQEFNPIEGHYSGSGEGELTVDLTHIDDDIYAISINTVVPMQDDGMPGCGGGIDGEVILDSTGGNFFVENENYDPDSTSPMFSERYCEISLTFDGESKLVLEEKSGCTEYHGAACGFTGELEHDAAGI